MPAMPAMPVAMPALSRASLHSRNGFTTVLEDQGATPRIKSTPRCRVDETLSPLRTPCLQTDGRCKQLYLRE